MVSKEAFYFRSCERKKRGNKREHKKITHTAPGNNDGAAWSLFEPRPDAKTTGFRHSSHLVVTLVVGAPAVVPPPGVTPPGPASTPATGGPPNLPASSPTSPATAHPSRPSPAGLISPVILWRRLLLLPTVHHGIVRVAPPAAARDARISTPTVAATAVAATAVAIVPGVLHCGRGGVQVVSSRGHAAARVAPVSVAAAAAATPGWTTAERTPV